MSFGRGGGRGGRGGRGGGGAGRGALAELSLGTLSFADLLATSRADIGGVLYPTTGVNIPVTDLPSAQEAQTVALEVDRWIYPTHPPSRHLWIVDGVIKPNIGSKKPKTNQGSLSKPFIHQLSKLGLESQSCASENWLYSDRYKSNSSNVQSGSGTDGNNPNQFKFLHLLEKSFFPPDLWTSFNEGKKKIIVRKTKSRRSTGKAGLSGMIVDDDGQEEGGGEKDEKDEEEIEVAEEEEIDEDDPDYDNNYFDNGDDDEGMDSGGDGGDDD